MINGHEASLLRPKPELAGGLARPNLGGMNPARHPLRHLQKRLTPRYLRGNVPRPPLVRVVCGHIS